MTPFTPRSPCAGPSLRCARSRSAGAMKRIPGGCKTWHRVPLPFSPAGGENWRMEIRPPASEGAETVVSVLVPVAVAAPYTYRAPAAARPGDIVAVPLGSRSVVGVIWDDPPDVEIGEERLRSIAGTFDAPPLSAEIRRFVDWVA